MTALFFAAGAAYAAIRAIRLQDEQIRRMDDSERSREEERRSEQASQVAAWAILDATAQPSVMCVNTSGRPVYNVSFTLRAGSSTRVCEYAVKGPDSDAKQLNFATRRMLAMGRSADTDWTGLYRSGDLRVSMRFLDATGNSWERSEQGLLTNITS